MRVEMNNKDDHQVETNVKESDIEKEQIPSLESPDWRREKISVMDIELDRENPRLNLSENASKKDVIDALFREANIDKLISSILEYGRVYPGENIIVVQENNKYIVVEGNRRVCSLQCIINPELIPIEKREEIKEIIINSNIDILNLKEIDADISPSRDDAQKIITGRHTKYQIEKWPYVPKWRRDYKAFNKHKDEVKVAELLGENVEDVKKNLKNYSFLQYVWDMPCWKSSEKEILKRNKLEGSVLEWHVRSILDILNITFDKEYKMQTDIDKKKLEFVLERFIRSIYLNGKPDISTRKSRQLVQKQLEQWINEYEENKSKQEINEGNTKNHNSNDDKGSGKTSESETKNSGSSDKNRKGKSPVPYFKNLNKEMTVDDPRLVMLTYELSKTNMEDRPATGVILARSLIESALLFRIDRKKLTEKLRSDNKQKPLEEIKLSRVLHFCIQNAQKLFSDYTKAEQSLKVIQSERLKYMNSIVHNGWLIPSADKVAGIAGDSRELLRVILTDSP